LRKNSFKVAAMFIASVIGAGFASGKEIFSFFSRYNKASIYGLGLSGAVFFVFTYCLYNIIYKYRNRADSFSDILPSYIGVFYNIFSFCLLFSIYTVMIAGLSSAGEMIFGINGTLFGVICTVIFMIIFVSGKTVLINSSLIISPIMCMGILFTGIYYLLLSKEAVFNPFEETSYMWILSSVAYVSYNSVPLISLFWETRELFTSKEVCLKGAFMGCMSLTFISIVLDFLIKEFFVKIKVLDIPMLYISESIGFGAEIISKAVLILAMVSTALSCGFSLTGIIEGKTGSNRLTTVSAVCISGLVLSVFGFSNLIEYVYPLFGYTGFVIIVYIIWLFLSNCITFDKNIR